MVITRVVASARIARTTPKASTATSARASFTGHTEKSGVTTMSVNLATVIISFRLETVKRKRVVASADRSSTHPIVTHARMDTSGTPTVVHVNVTSMAPSGITVRRSTASALASPTLAELIAGSALRDITISRSVNLAVVTRSVPSATCAVTNLDNVSVGLTLLVSIARSARMDSSTIPLVPTVIVMFAARWMKCATKALENASVEKGMEGHDATSAFQVTTTTQIVYRATAPVRVVLPRFAM